MLKPHEISTLQQMAKAVTAQFGKNCEVCVHEVSPKSVYGSIVVLENGHVTGRKLGDGPSHVVVEELGRKDGTPEDRTCYLTRTPDGKILKSSSVYIKDESGNVRAIFCINFDISALSMLDNAIQELISPEPTAVTETPERIVLSVSDLLDDLVRQSVELVGKPVALMTKDDKVKAIQFLNRNGALLVTKSGDKISKFFGISKYTLYSYLDVKTGGETYD